MSAPERTTSGRRQAFGRGFHQRSPLVLVAAALLLALTLLGAELIARDGFVTRVSEGRFVRYRNDDSGNLGYQMALLKKSPPSGSVVYLLGGSATMESFLDAGSLSADVSIDARRPVTVISMAGHAETLGGSLTIVDNLPRTGGLIAVGLSPGRFTASPQDDSSLLVGYPYLVPSPPMRAALAGTSARLSPADVLFPGFVKYAVTYLEQRVRVRLTPFIDIGYSKHYTIDGPLYSVAQKLHWAQGDVTQDASLYAQNADYNFAVLKDLVLLARQRGFSVVFFDQPINPDIIGPTWHGLVPLYRKRAAALAAQLDVPYLRVGQVVHLQNSDFLDDYHLVVRGRLKWQPVLSRELAQNLPAGQSTSYPSVGAAP